MNPTADGGTENANDNAVGLQTVCQDLVRNVAALTAQLELSKKEVEDLRGKLRKAKQREKKTTEANKRAKALNYSTKELKQADQDRFDDRLKITSLERTLTEQTEKLRTMGLKGILGPRHTASTAKRNVSESFDSQEPQAKKAKLNKRVPDKVVKCIKCWKHDWDCDNGQPCNNCIFKHKHFECKRVKCKNYEGKSCKDRFCSFAHQGDNFIHLAEHMQIRRDNLGLKEPNHELENSYDDFLDELENNTGNLNAEEDEEDGGVEL